MTESNTVPYGALILRVAMGILFLAHAGMKIFVFTPAGTAGFFASLGLPGWLAYLTMTAEVLGGAALILGVYTRVVALALIPILLGAIVTVHAAKGFWADAGGWEFVGFWALSLLALALIGDGALALKPTTKPAAKTQR